MTLLLDSALRSSAVLGLALIATLLLRNRSAALRHWILSAAVLCSLLMPVATLVMPAWNVSPSVSNALPMQFLPARSEPVSFQSKASPPHVEMLPTQSIERIWLSGFFVTLLALIIGIVRLARVAWRAERVADGVWFEVLESFSRRVRLNRRVRLLRSKTSAMLVTWGFLRPQVLLPVGSEEWAEERVNVVLAHELAHVRRQDWLLHIAAEFLRAVFWFNPLVWIVCKRLRLESEFAADDAVLAEGVAASRYAAHLLEIVVAVQQSGSAWSSATPMARASTIERRFSAMLNPNKSHRPISRIATVVVAIMLLSASLSLAALSAPAKLPLVVPAKPPIIEPARPVSAPPVQVQTTQQAAQPQLASPASPQTFSGEIVTFDLKGTDIRDFFKAIAGISGLNVTLDPDVTGNLTITLKDVPWDQALDIVLRNYNLGAQLQGRVLRIATSGTLSAESRARLGAGVALDFDIIRSGVSVAKTTMAVQSNVQAMRALGNFGIVVTPTLVNPDRTELDFGFSVRGTTFAAKGLAVWTSKPAKMFWETPDGAYEINISLAPPR
jgi:beta-lactamase regulating signal transducer with metallopeptidase domain